MTSPAEVLMHRVSFSLDASRHRSFDAADPGNIAIYFQLAGHNSVARHRLNPS